MLVSDFGGETEAASEADIDRAFARRFADDANALCFFPLATEFPCMQVLVKGHLAWATYMPSGDDAGWVSDVGVEGYPRGQQSCIFYLWIGQPQWVLNDAIMPIQHAVAAAKELLVSPNLPKSIRWFRL